MRPVHLAGGRPLPGHRGLPPPARRQHAERRIADDPRVGEPARRRSGDHRRDRRGAAGAPARRSIAGVTELTSVFARPAARSSCSSIVAEHRGRGARRAGGSTPRSPICRATCRRSRRSASSILIRRPRSSRSRQSNVSPSAIYDVADTPWSRRTSRRSRASPTLTVSGAEQPAVRVRVSPGGSRWPGSRRAGAHRDRGRNAQARSAGRRRRVAQTIGTNDQLRRAPDYRTLVVKSSNGNIVRLSDIAAASSRARATAARPPGSTASRRCC